MSKSRHSSITNSLLVATATATAFASYLLTKKNSNVTNPATETWKRVTQTDLKFLKDILYNAGILEFLDFEVFIKTLCGFRSGRLSNVVHMDTALSYILTAGSLSTRIYELNRTSLHKDLLISDSLFFAAFVERLYAFTKDQSKIEKFLNTVLTRKNNSFQFKENVKIFVTGGRLFFSHNLYNASFQYKTLKLYLNEDNKLSVDHDKITIFSIDQHGHILTKDGFLMFDGGINEIPIDGCLQVNRILDDHKKYVIFYEMEKNHYYFDRTLDTIYKTLTATNITWDCEDYIEVPIHYTTNFINIPPVEFCNDLFMYVRDTTDLDKQLRLASPKYLIIGEHARKVRTYSKNRLLNIIDSYSQSKGICVWRENKEQLIGDDKTACFQYSDAVILRLDNITELQQLTDLDVANTFLEAAKTVSIAIIVIYKNFSILSQIYDLFEVSKNFTAFPQSLENTDCMIAYRVNQMRNVVNDIPLYNNRHAANFIIPLSMQVTASHLLPHYGNKKATFKKSD